MRLISTYFWGEHPIVKNYTFELFFDYWTRYFDSDNINLTTIREIKLSIVFNLIYPQIGIMNEMIDLRFLGARKINIYEES